MGSPHFSSQFYPFFSLFPVKPIFSPPGFFLSISQDPRHLFASIFVFASCLFVFDVAAVFDGAVMPPTLQSTLLFYEWDFVGHGYI